MANFITLIVLAVLYLVTEGARKRKYHNAFKGHNYDILRQGKLMQEYMKWHRDENGKIVNRYPGEAIPLVKAQLAREGKEFCEWHGNRIHPDHPDTLCK